MYDELEKDPLGIPDAPRSISVKDIADVGSRGFVKINTKINSGITENNNSLCRVIVGKKGSGKTLYLRRLYINLNDEVGVYKESSNDVFGNNNKFHVSEAFSQLKPSTEDIIKFSQLFNGEFLTEKWRELWRRAILRSLITHILYSKYLTSYKANIPHGFKRKYLKILSKATTPVTIFSQVVEIINSIHNADDFNIFINNILWFELDTDLGIILRDYPPMYFYIDAIDDEYQHAPIYWMRSQKGLFYSVMQFLREPMFGGKLHIIISIRDHVYSSILSTSEHVTRYLDEVYITVLYWDYESTKYLLEQKLKYLDNRYFILEDGNNIESLLGISKIQNTKRNIEEPVVEYLIRHTRAIPRDIIEVGNRLCNKIIEFKQNKIDFINFEDEIKKIVHMQAEIIASEQLQISANHLTANLMPSDAISLGIDKMYTSRYTAEDDYLNLAIRFKDIICDIICYIGKDRFTSNELEDAKNYAKSKFGLKSDLNVFDVLWQNGLIGYEYNESEAVFFKENSINFQMPNDKRKYAFHTILIDKLNLNAIGRYPVKIKYN